jgi:hypothetical protein
VTWAVWATYTPRTVVVYGSTPAGYEVESLPEDAEIVEVEGETYYLSDHTFYQRIQRDGQDVYVVVDAPAGAQVTSIPEDVVEHVLGGTAATGRGGARRAARRCRVVRGGRGDLLLRRHGPVRGG